MSKVNRRYWKNRQPPLEFVLDWYDAWLRCDELKKVIAALELGSCDNMATWMSYPELKMAKELADSRRGSRNTFSGYIFKSMSKEARKVWERCQFWDNCDSSYEQIERILRGETKRIRQELFLHALVSSNFDLSEAMRMVALPAKTFIHWKENDLEFRQLVEEIQWHKKNFFEHALVDLVEQRHPAAVLFVNRTINADRGYGEKMEVQHNVNVGIRLEELDLDVDTKRKILDAMRRKQAGDSPNGQKAIDVESTSSLPDRFPELAEGVA